MTYHDPFDLNSAPVGEPLSIVVGASTQWRREIDIDPVLFEMEYRLRRFNPTEAAQGEDLSSNVISLDHVDGSAWGADVLSATTTGWPAGRFFWDLVVTRISDSRTKVIDTGDFYVFGSSDDRRSHAQIMIAKIESILNGRADDDVESYSIKTRSITKMDVSELREWRDYYLRELSNEPQIDGGIFRSRGPNPSTLKVRFR